MSIMTNYTIGGASEAARQITEEDERVRQQAKRATQARHASEQAAAQQRFDQRLRQADVPAASLPAATVPTLFPPASAAAKMDAAPNRDAESARSDPARPSARQMQGADMPAVARKVARIPEGGEPERRSARHVAGNSATDTTRMRQAAGPAPGQQSVPPAAIDAAQSRQTEPMLPRTRPADAGAPASAAPVSDAADRLETLVSSIGGQGMRLTDERLLGELQELGRLISGQLQGSPPAPAPGEAAASRQPHERVRACIEFMAGYFEAGNEPASSRPKAGGVRAELRDCLAQIEQALQIAAAIPADVAQRALATGAIRPTASVGRNPVTGSAKDKEVGERETQASIPDAAATGMATRPIEPAATARSSQLRDAEKRKGETLVEVTLRSV